MDHATRAARAAISRTRSRAGRADERRDRKNQEQVFHMNPPLQVSISSRPRRDEPAQSSDRGSRRRHRGALGSAKPLVWLDENRLTRAGRKDQSVLRSRWHLERQSTRRAAGRTLRMKRCRLLPVFLSSASAVLTTRHRTNTTHGRSLPGIAQSRQRNR